jgi:hypothetical protein
MNRKITQEIILLGIVVAFLHKIALSWSLYWSVWWYDIMMHFLGGFLIALIVLLIIARFKIIILNPNLIFLLMIGGVSIVGLGWELFEVFFELIDIKTSKLDTILDLVMDVLGAVAAFFYSKKRFFKNNILQDSN